MLFNYVCPIFNVYFSSFYLFMDCSLGDLLPPLFKCFLSVWNSQTCLQTCTSLLYSYLWNCDIRAALCMHEVTQYLNPVLNVTRA